VGRYTMQGPRRHGWAGRRVRRRRAWPTGRLSTTASGRRPWGYGNSLEWATSSRPPRHNFLEIPRIRSERPAFEAHYPHLVARLHAESRAGGRQGPYTEISEVVTDDGFRQGRADRDAT
jgi:cytochrome c oxidase subunit 1